MMPIVISRLLTVSRDISVFSLFESLLPITAKEPSTFLPLTQQPAVHIELGMTIFGSFEVRFGVPGGLNAFTLFPFCISACLRCQSVDTDPIVLTTRALSIVPYLSFICSPLS